MYLPSIISSIFRVDPFFTQIIYASLSIIFSCSISFFHDIIIVTLVIVIVIVLNVNIIISSFPPLPVSLSPSLFPPSHISATSPVSMQSPPVEPSLFPPSPLSPSPTFPLTPSPSSPFISKTTLASTNTYPSTTLITSLPLLFPSIFNATYQTSPVIFISCVNITHLSSFEVISSFMNILLWFIFVSPLLYGISQTLINFIATFSSITFHGLIFHSF